MSVELRYLSDDLISAERTAPAVSFDIDLGKKYEEVTFDSDAYEKHLLDNGVTSAQAGQLAVRFSVGRGRSSEYVDNRIGIQTSNTANKKLAHETQHYIYEQRGERTTFQNTVTGINNLARAGGMGAVLAATASEAGGYLMQSESLMDFGLKLGQIGSVALLGSFPHYLLNKDERLARKAERTVQTTFISLTQRR